MRVSFAHIVNFAALATLAGAATMQAAQQGTFHLSTPAHWGQAVLAPGDYKLTTPAASLGHFGFRVENAAGKAVFEYPLVTDSSEVTSSSSYLKLSEINGNYYIREFSSGATGKTFTFGVPKATRRQQMANGQDSGFALAVR